MIVTILSVLFAAALIFAMAIFLLSVIVPMKSQKRFWIRIRKLRNGLDKICYWIFNGFAILAFLCVIWALLNKALQ